MKYIKFIIKNYRAITNPIEIDIKKNKLVPLIGTNESGKTTILQAIYAFDYANDKEYESMILFNSVIIFCFSFIFVLVNMFFHFSNGSFIFLFPQKIQ